MDSGDTFYTYSDFTFAIRLFGNDISFFGMML